MDKKIIINEKYTQNYFRQIKQKKKIVLCHGSFDVVHPGHIKHFEECKKFGDILVVSITADKFIKKGIHNPYFNQETRLDFLKQLKIIDYCFIVNEATGVPAIELVKPHYYCKGMEYKKLKDKNLFKEIKALKKNRGKIKFLGSDVKSSSEIISKFLFQINDNSFRKKILSLKKINLIKIFERIKRLKILIIGEIIIDEYTFVEMKGISPKSSTLSCIKKDNKIMPGGTLATYKFLSSLSNQTKLISVINEENYKSYRKNFHNLKDLIISKNFSKIKKNRLVSKDANQSLQKIFTINDFREKELNFNDEKKLIKKINMNAKDADLIIVQDFGHGLFSKKISKTISKFSKKISLNVQANSLNYGFNIVGDKLKKCKTLVLDERELQLNVGNKNFDYSQKLSELRKKLSAKYAFLTRGDKYSILVDQLNNKITVPKLNNKPIDAMGAGDIFHGMASVMCVTSTNSFLNLFLSQIAGAHAVDIEGNSDFPKLNQIIKTFNFYLNQSQKI